MAMKLTCLIITVAIVINMLVPREKVEAKPDYELHCEYVYMLNIAK